ncbi:hypothetical protein BLNAU_7331 [Blattamonas nauphoetae]|uniref:Transmembrane protein n=1 Tax=Blattamonas nauphoetae TaxID=2049346 RepID=A0ABQ9Y1R3_9EUKA|nr:hypothetical protein BLNAU_7331 [Blattamonas nauphoetae]
MSHRTEPTNLLYEQCIASIRHCSCPRNKYNSKCYPFFAKQFIHTLYHPIQRNEDHFSSSELFFSEIGTDENLCGSVVRPCATLNATLTHCSSETTRIHFSFNTTTSPIQFLSPIILQGRGNPFIFTTNKPTDSSLQTFTLRAHSSLNDITIDFTSSTHPTLFHVQGCQCSLRKVSLIGNESMTKIFQIESGALALETCDLSLSMSDLSDLVGVQDGSSLAFTNIVFANKIASSYMVDFPGGSSTKLAITNTGLSHVTVPYYSPTILRLVDSEVSLLHSSFSTVHYAQTVLSSSINQRSYPVCVETSRSAFAHVEASTIIIHQSSFVHLSPVPFYFWSVSAEITETIFHNNSPSPDYPSFQNSISCNGDSRVRLDDVTTIGSDRSMWMSQDDSCIISHDSDDVSFTYPVLSSSGRSGESLSLWGHNLIPCSLRVILFNQTSHGNQDEQTVMECLSVNLVNDTGLECTIPYFILKSPLEEWRAMVQLRLNNITTVDSNSIVVIAQRKATASAADLAALGVCIVIVVILTIVVAIFIIVFFYVLRKRSGVKVKQDYLQQQRFAALEQNSVHQPNLHRELRTPTFLSPPPSRRSRHRNLCFRHQLPQVDPPEPPSQEMITITPTFLDQQTLLN